MHREARDYYMLHVHESIRRSIEKIGRRNKHNYAQNIMNIIANDSRDQEIVNGHLKLIV